MKTTTNRSVVIAFSIVVAILTLFGGRALTAGILNGVAQQSAWIGVYSWMWTPAFVTLALGVVLGSFIFKKKV